MSGIILETEWFPYDINMLFINCFHYQLHGCGLKLLPAILFQIILIIDFVGFLICGYYNLNVSLTLFHVDILSVFCKMSHLIMICFLEKTFNNKISRLLKNILYTIVVSCSLGNWTISDLQILNPIERFVHVCTSFIEWNQQFCQMNWW